MAASKALGAEKVDSSASESIETEVVHQASVQELAALERVKRYAGWSAAGGLLPVPGLDVAAILATQVKMLADIADIYDVPFQRDLAKQMVGTLVGSFGPVTLAQASGSLIKTIPFVGNVATMFWQPALASAATWAVGKVFIQHFESGGTFLDFKPETVREYFRQQFNAARRGAKGKADATADATADAS